MAPLVYGLREAAALEEGAAAAAVLGVIAGVSLLAVPLIGLWLGSRIAWILLLVLDVLTVSAAVVALWGPGIVVSGLRMALLLSTPVREHAFDRG